MIENDSIQNRIEKLGNYSFKKSYLPELQTKSLELNLFKTIFEQIADFVIVAKVDNGYAEFINNSANQFFNCNNKKYAAYISDIISPKYWRIIKNWLNNNTEPAKSLNFKYQVNINDKNYYTENSVSIVNYLNKNYVVSIIRDITDSLTAEMRLVEAKEKAELLVRKNMALFDALPDTIIIFNPKGVIKEIYYDSGSEQILFFENAVGKHISEFFNEDVVNDMSDKIHKVYLTKEIQHFNFDVNFNNNAKHFDGRIVFVDDYSVLAVLRDITEKTIMINELKKAKQQAEESDRLKSAFLANMSHEVRTPLNGIVGFVGLLAERELDPVYQNFMNIIQSSSDDLLRIIDDILDISKLEAGHIKLINKVFNFNNMLDDLNDIYKQKIEKLDKNIQITCFKNLPDEQAVLFSDELRFKQIIINLLDNACKFTKHGIVEFGYNLVNNFVEFYVKDTGIGIRADHLTFIFDRFRQSDENIGRNFGGTGLGLSISKGLVTLLGGNIWVESEIGSGSTFYFTVPYNKLK